MTPSLKISRHPLKSVILLLILLLLVNFRSFSQTTDTTRKIWIDAPKAMRIAKDLEAFKSLKLEDSIRIENIKEYKHQLRLDSVSISLYLQKISLQSQIITDLGNKNTLQEGITKQYKKQASAFKWERNGVVVAVVVILLKVLIK